MKKCSLIILIVIFSLLCACGKTPINNQSSNNTSSILEENFIEIKGSEIKEVEITLEAQLLLTNSGEVYSWGLNDQGVLGLGITDTKQFVNLPTKVGLPEPIADIVCSPDSNSVVAVSESGNLYAWGPNHHSIFPQITEPVLYSPKKLEISFKVKNASLSYHYLTLEDVDGNFYSGGDNTYYYEVGMLDELPASKLEPINVQNVSKMYTANFGRVYVDQNGDVFLQGTFEGEMTTNFKKISLLPEKIVDVDTLTQGMVCLSETGKLYFIGQDSNFIVSGENKTYSTPTLIEKMNKKVTDFDIATSYITVKTEDNEFYAWGYNHSVIDTQRYNEKIEEPQKIDFPADITYYNTGWFSAVAIDSKGEIYAVGSTYYKLFCDDSLPQYNEAVKIKFKKNS